MHISKRKWLVIAAALAVCIVAALMLAFTRNVPTVSAQTEAPDWLQAYVPVCLKYFEGEPTRAAWVETTRSHYTEALNVEAPSVASSDTGGLPAYVVVVHGSFVSNMSAPVVDGKSSPPSGTVLVLTFDGTTHDLTNMDLLRTEPSQLSSSLGQMMPLELPSPGSVAPSLSPEP